MIRFQYTYFNRYNITDYSIYFIKYLINRNILTIKLIPQLAEQLDLSDLGSAVTCCLIDICINSKITNIKLFK